MKPTSIFLFAAAAEAGITRSVARGTLSNCHSIEIGPKENGDWVLQAECSGEKGVGVVLDECIGNNNGVLMWQKGDHFSRSCKQCKQLVNEDDEPGTSLYMQCRCRTTSGSTIEQEMFNFDLSARLYYQPGVGGEQGSIQCIL